MFASPVARLMIEALLTMNKKNDHKNAISNIFDLRMQEAKKGETEDQRRSFSSNDHCHLSAFEAR